MKFRSLRSRLFAGMTAVIACFLFLSLLTLLVTTRRFAQREITQSFEAGKESLDRFLDLRYSLLNGVARSAAQTPYLKATLTIDGLDTETLRQAGEQLVSVANMPLLFLADGAGELVVSTDPKVRAQGVPLGVVLDAARDGVEHAGIWCGPDSCHQVSGAPVLVGAQVVGVVAVATPIDDVFAADAKRVTGLDIAFLSSDRVIADTRGPRVPRRTSDERAASEPASNVDDTDEPNKAPQTLFPSERFEELAQANEGALTVVLHPAFDVFGGFYTQTLGWFLGTSITVSLFALAVCRRLTERICRPLSTLTEAAGHVAEGDLEVNVSDGGRDEVGLLATSFNRMTGRIRRLLDEGSQREEALEQAQVKAEASNRAKSQFLANISHEIRTPMNGVLGMSELLADSDMTETQQKLSCGIRESAEALLRVIDEVLDFSKIEAGKLELEAAPFCPRDVVQSVAALMGREAERNGVALVCDVDDDVPESAVGDSGRLRQILINLAGNAVKFTAEGEIVLGASVDKTEGDLAVLRFVVRDTGVGIPRDEVERIFDAFTQADGSMARKYEGTGLGLTIARNLATSMGGQIGVDSEPGRGSEFWFTAGVDVVREGHQGTPARDHVLRPVNGDAFSHRRVLLVEDNEVNQQVARLMLERMGCRVDLAENGMQAIAALQNMTYDLILMDGQMPGMDGYEASRRIRRLETNDRPDGASARIPIIAVTAHAMPGDREQCAAAGMDDYMSKPFTRSVLANMLSKWLPESPLPAGDEPPDGGSTRQSVDEIIDHTALDEIRALASADYPDILSRVVTLYLGKSSKLVTQVTEAIDSGDPDTVRLAAHSLKSASANVGAMRVSALCAQLEECDRTLPMDETRNVLSAMQVEHAAANAALSEQLSREHTHRTAVLGMAQPAAHHDPESLCGRWSTDQRQRKRVRRILCRQRGETSCE